MIQGSAPIFIDCVFLDNTAGAGAGGLCITDGGAPVVIGCEFLWNGGADGGALYMEDGAPVQLIDCVIAHNHAGDRGGAIHAVDSYPTISQCTISNNTSGHLGGGIYLYNSLAEISNTIITDNEYPVFSCFEEGGATLSCCDVYGNGGGDWIGCIAGQEGINGNLCLDPLFCGEGAPIGPYTLNSDSPCAPDYNPECGLIGALPVRCGAADAAEERRQFAGLRLEAPVPNPTGSAAGLRFTVPPSLSGKPLRLTIHGADGRLLRLLGERSFTAGEHELHWDGTDQAGASCAPGVYFARLVAGDEQRCCRVVRLR